MREVVELKDLLPQFKSEEQAIIVEIISYMVDTMKRDHPNVSFSRNAALEVMIKAWAWERRDRSKDERLDD